MLGPDVIREILVCKEKEQQQRTSNNWHFHLEYLEEERFGIFLTVAVSGNSAKAVY